MANENTQTRSLAQIALETQRPTLPEILAEAGYGAYLPDVVSSVAQMSCDLAAERRAANYNEEVVTELRNRLASESEYRTSAQVALNTQSGLVEKLRSELEASKEEQVTTNSRWKERVDEIKAAYDALKERSDSRTVDRASAAVAEADTQVKELRKQLREANLLVSKYKANGASPLTSATIDEPATHREEIPADYVLRHLRDVADSGYYGDAAMAKVLIATVKKPRKFSGHGYMFEVDQVLDTDAKHLVELTFKSRTNDEDYVVYGLHLYAGTSPIKQGELVWEMLIQGSDSRVHPRRRPANTLPKYLNAVLFDYAQKNSSAK